MRIYVDTSAAMKLLVEETESLALARAFDSTGAEDVVLSSWLLYVELHCAALRRGSIPPDAVEAVLAPLLLVDLERADLIGAARRGWTLRSQDSIHLAVAIRTGADTVVTYDAEQAAAARTLGLQVLQPA